MPIRDFLNFLGLIFFSTCCSVVGAGEDHPQGTGNLANADQPNILWLSTEDIGPHVGCYGDPDATTPNLDAFAANSLTYDVAWSNYPVCAPARTTIIAGMYASSNAAGNMRSEVVMPEGVEMFPHYLRQAGYYCTNNSKEDYNYLAPKNAPWDESSRKAHYRNRKQGQPFFAVFNYTGTHESKIRKRPHDAVIDPAEVTLPKYYPDVPEIRQDWAQYLDNITVMDGWIQKQLDGLKRSGQADNTIVIFFGDHGSGMPRHKRFAGDSGMRVPFIVHVPEKWKKFASPDYSAGGRTKRPVGFVDLAPTMLSVAGIQPPQYMQGHAFLGPYQTAAPTYVYGCRDRMDERMDISRSIRDDQFIYVRNYMSNLPAGQHIQYQQETPSTAVWNRMFVEGKLNEVQSHFWKRHPPEELYDLANDPEETVNLVADPKYKQVLDRFRLEHRDSMKRFGDLGLIPESIALDFAKGKKSRRQMLEDPAQFPLDEIFEIANLASNQGNDLGALLLASQHESATVRYWGAMGILIRGESAYQKCQARMAALLDDPCDAVGIVAAETIVRFGSIDQKKVAIDKLCKLADYRESNLFAAIAALNSIDRIGEPSQQIKQALSLIPTQNNTIKRGNGYVATLKEKIVGKKSSKNQE